MFLWRSQSLLLMWDMYTSSTMSSVLFEAVGEWSMGVFIPTILLFCVTEQLAKLSGTLRPSVRHCCMS